MSELDRCPGSQWQIEPINRGLKVLMSGRNTRTRSIFVIQLLYWGISDSEIGRCQSEQRHTDLLLMLEDRVWMWYIH